MPTIFPLTFQGSRANAEFIVKSEQRSNEWANNRHMRYTAPTMALFSPVEGVTVDHPAIRSGANCQSSREVLYSQPINVFIYGAKNVPPADSL